MKKLVIGIIAVIVIGMTSCNPATGQKPSSTPAGQSPAAGQSSTTTPGGTPSTPSNSITLTETDLLTAFSLTKGSITASAAAKRIETGTPTGSSITFTGKKYTAYDDQAGTFTVEVKGTKDGKNFSQKISVTGFTYPLKDKMVQSLASCELNFDDAIEYNYSLKKYIEEVNKDPSGIKLLKKLSFLLNDGTTTIVLGEHDGYTLTAKAKKAGTQVLVQPSVMFRKLAEGGTEEFIKNTDFGFTHLKSQLTRDYFTSADVFQYVLDKTADADAIKADSNEFASWFYAGAKKTGQSPDELFTPEFKAKVQHYKDIYHNNPNGHLELKISYGIYQPKGDGVKADDYTGTITVDLCIATDEQISSQSGIMAIKTDIKKSGFASIPDDAALAKKEHLFFHLIPKIPLTDELKTQWEKKEFSNYILLRTNESAETAEVHNPFTATNIPFKLSVNGSDDNLSSHLGCAVFGASKTKNGKIIFIENIRLQKADGSKFMKVYVKLKGSEKILTVTADPGY